MNSQSVRAGLVFLALAGVFDVSQAQSPSTPITPTNTNDQTQGQPGFTFKANARVVLTDVTVKDAKGNPVHGLPQSAFHIFDKKQPQSIQSFEEHSEVLQATAPSAPQNSGVYSNDYLQHLPSVLNLIVLDSTNLEIPEQMYLNVQLTKFLNNLPKDQQLAIYLRGGDHAILLQNFTSDRSLLLAALHKAIPRFPPTGREYLSDVDTLRQLAIYLSQLPGRKNIIWFSGGSTLYLKADAGVVESNPNWRNLYDELERERIAVYPVDARGLTTNGGRFSVFAQQAVMEDVAHATGGHAFYNTNGMSEAANAVLNTDESFYTLTYSPRNFRSDHKWHNVRIAVDGGPYQLSYRSGYFADGPIDSPEQPAKSRTLITVNGERSQVSPQLSSVPVIFQARVLPASAPALTVLPDHSATVPASPPNRGEVTYTVRYMLPADELTVQDSEGKKRVTFGIAAMAFNENGRAIVRKGERVTMTLNGEILEKNPSAPLTINQQINLQKGDEYLYLAVWDMASGRLGTLQVALDVPKPAKQ
jgi:VWFA-related protein